MGRIAFSRFDIIEEVEDSGSARIEGTMFESGDDSAPAEAAQLERGAMLSRYMLVERIGLGGMGVVWSAYDPELDRKLAIKLLRPRVDRGRSELARTRLIREAQVIARISHPNVVAIHDVGEHDGQVYIAMEFVQGKTLRRWVRATRRDWQEIVAMFVQAGRGLAAAHRVGLVHRDFKPANVLIGPDGRARVLDFGLARSVEAPFDEDPEAEAKGQPDPEAEEGGAKRRAAKGQPDPEAEEGGAKRRAAKGQPDPGPTESWSVARIQRLDPNPIVTPLTRTGSMVGTPAYMAPEQFEGGHFDARTDQFSFCVALWEALHGRRPFGGETIDELRAAVCGNKVVAPLSDSRVPGVIDRALRRGLAVDPAARWPSMDELLAELSRDPASGRRRWLIAGGVVASFVAALIITPMLGSRPATDDRCPDGRVEVDRLWNSARRQSISAAMLAGDRPDRAQRWSRLATALDRYAGAYVVARDRVCESSDPRARCLDDRLHAFGLAIELLDGGDARLLDGADTVLTSLPSIDACARPRYLAAAGFERDRDTPLDLRSAQRRRLIVARIAAERGELEQATDQLEALLREADDDPTLRIEVLIEVALAEQLARATPRARERLEQAVVAAVRENEDMLAATAATALIDLVGVELGDLDAGLRWAARAEAWHTRIDAPPIDHAKRLIAEGELQRRHGELEAAGASFGAALRRLSVVDPDLDLAALDPPASRVASRALLGLAEVALAGADLGVARSRLSAAWFLRSNSFGIDHPETARVALDLARVEIELGDWRAAAIDLARALPDARSHPAMDPEQAARAQLELARFRLARAELLPEELGELEPLVLEAVDAARSRGVAVERALLTLAWLDRLLGRFEQAEQTLAALGGDLQNDALALERAELRLAAADPERALAELEQVAGEQPELAACKGRALWMLGRSDEARVELERALASWDQLAPDGHPRAVVTLEALASLAGPESRYRSRSAVIRAGVP